LESAAKIIGHSSRLLSDFLKPETVNRMRHFSDRGKHDTSSRAPLHKLDLFVEDRAR
jgi:hypothetical protein